MISVATDAENKVTEIILRDVRETKKESFVNIDGSCELTEVGSILNLAKIVSPDLEIETLEEIECDDIKVDIKFFCIKCYIFPSFRSGSH